MYVFSWVDIMFSVGVTILMNRRDKFWFLYNLLLEVEKGINLLILVLRWGVMGEIGVKGIDSRGI